MQSGHAQTEKWVFEYEPAGRKTLDPLMGWTGSGDTNGQIRLEFANQAEAVAFAKRHGIEYSVQTPQERRPKPKAYADNFAYGRREPWSH